MVFKVIVPGKRAIHTALRASKIAITWVLVIIDNMLLTFYGSISSWNIEKYGSSLSSCSWITDKRDTQQ